MSQKLKVSRAGTILGDFSREEVLEGLSKETFLPTDYFWDPENKSAGWQELGLLPKTTAQMEPTQTGHNATANIPISTSPNPPNKQGGYSPLYELGYFIGHILSWFRVIWNGLSHFMGTAAIVIGLFYISESVFSDQVRSAIHQGVLAQWMTNGLLLILIGIILKRK
jgi:hypothetical protein